MTQNKKADPTTEPVATQSKKTGGLNTSSGTTKSTTAKTSAKPSKTTSSVEKKTQPTTAAATSKTASKTPNAKSTSQRTQAKSSAQTKSEALSAKTTSVKASGDTQSIKKKTDTKPTTTGTIPKPSPKTPAPEASKAPPPVKQESAPAGKDVQPAASATVETKPLPSGINALSLLKQSGEDGSGSAKPDTHHSAAEVIAKTVSRDHPASGTHARPAEDKKSTTATGKKARLVPKMPIPAEPKEPIGGVGAAGLAPPLVAGETIASVLNADLQEPFSFFGMHKGDATDTMIIRVFLPEATNVKVLDASQDKVLSELKKVHDEGLFVGKISGHKQPIPYRLQVTTPSGKKTIDDPYRFPPILSDKDTAELASGECLTVYDLLGAHPTEIEGVSGVTFAVWAPNATHVSVVGDFNDWDGRCHGMRLRKNCGVWEIFLPGVSTGALYKYELKHSQELAPELKSDPFAFSTETPLGTASIVQDNGATFRWKDEAWMKNRKDTMDKAVSFYEVHLGSWRRKPEENSRWLTYREIADELVTYCSDLGFTHISLLPISEHTYDDTVGYLPSNLYAPTNRYGSPDDFRYLIDTCHRAGIGVVADWIPNYFSEEEHGLSFFDGTALYDHPNTEQGRDLDWNAPLYNLGRKEVTNYLLANALYWFERFHLDGLRISGLAKMFYLDYGRPEGGWTPNKDGGNENLEALAFIRRLNELVTKKYPGVMMIAEDSSLRGNLTKPVQSGGLGFSSRWNTAWAYDTLRYLGRNPVHRKYYQYELTNPLSYAFDENFILPVSYDHVSIGRGAMISKLPGDYWQKFSTLRAWYALMYTLPAKKLLFMGTEFGQDREWNSTISLDWHLLDSHMHKGLQGLIQALNNLHQKTPALHELDSNPQGFEWIDTADEDSSVISFLRYSKNRSKFVVVVTHITPVVRTDYRIGVPERGYYREILNTDAEAFGGGNQGSGGGATSEDHWAHGREHSICLTLPPYATVVLELDKEPK